MLVYNSTFVQTTVFIKLRYKSENKGDIDVLNTPNIAFHGVSIDGILRRKYKSAIGRRLVVIIGILTFFVYFTR